MEKKDIKKILTETVKDYNSISNKYSRVRREAWKEFDFLFKDISPKEKVLDLGCGNGRFYNNVILKGAKYFGIDPSSEMIKICKSNYPEGSFKTAYGNDLPFEDEYFDKVFSIAVLHHIPSVSSRLEFLKEILRVLKKDGLMFLTAWDLKEKAEGKKDVMIPWYGSKGTYFHCFNLEELIQLAKDSSFSIIKNGEILIGKKPYSNFYIIGKK
jgi:ubiquinone/menaquinone biosynthesis C-methylase UbiE